MDTVTILLTAEHFAMAWLVIMIVNRIKKTESKNRLKSARDAFIAGFKQGFDECTRNDFKKIRIKKSR